MMKESKMEVKNEKEPEREEMSASDGESEHIKTEIMEDNMHETNIVLEDQNENDFRPRSPIKRTITHLKREKIFYYS